MIFVFGQHPSKHLLEGNHFPQTKISEVLCSQCARALLDGGLTGFWAGYSPGNQHILFPRHFWVDDFLNFPLWDMLASGRVTACSNWWRPWQKMKRWRRGKQRSLWKSPKKMKHDHMAGHDGSYTYCVAQASIQTQKKSICYKDPSRKKQPSLRGCFLFVFEWGSSL